MIIRIATIGDAELLAELNGDVQQIHADAWPSFFRESTNQAEVAFTVKDQWQNRGIGTFMLKFMTDLARRNGISGFTAEVLRDNTPMQTVFHNSDCRVTSHLTDDIYSFDLTF